MPPTLLIHVSGPFLHPAVANGTILRWTWPVGICVCATAGFNSLQFNLVDAFNDQSF